MSINSEDIEWLKLLYNNSWVTHSSSGFSRSEWVEDLPMKDEDKNRLFYILEKHQNEFLFVPGAGTFGFGFSMGVYEIYYPTYPGMPIEHNHLITITGKNLNSIKYEERLLFEHYTNTENNKRLAKEVGIKLKDYSYYEY